MAGLTLLADFADLILEGASIPINAQFGDGNNAFMSSNGGAWSMHHRLTVRMNAPRPPQHWSGECGDDPFAFMACIDFDDFDAVVINAACRMRP